MMNRRAPWWTIPVLATLIVGAVPRDAAAIIGWVEKMSGPGRFYGVQIPFDRLVCVVRGQKGELTGANLFTRTGPDNIACITDGGNDPMQIKAYLTAEVLLTHAGSSRRFPAVTYVAAKPLVFARIHRLLDVGAGVGFNRFSGSGFSFWETSVPLQARIYPPWGGSRWRAVQLHIQGDYFLGEFTGTEFRGDPTYSEKREFVPSFFLSFDVLRFATGQLR